jgi:hypothetical protein
MSILKSIARRVIAALRFGKAGQRKQLAATTGTRPARPASLKSRRHAYTVLRSTKLVIRS